LLILQVFLGIIKINFAHICSSYIYTGRGSFGYMSSMSFDDLLVLVEPLQSNSDV